MPLPVISGCWRAAVKGTTPVGTSWVNVLHFNWVGAGSAADSDLVALTTKIQKLYAGPAYTSGLGLIANCTSGVSLQQVNYTPLDGSGLSVAKTLTGAGATAGSSSPAEVAEVLTLRSGFRGRSRRGRIYLPPFANGSMTSTGQVNATYTATCVAQAAGFLADIPSINWNWVVASYKLGITSVIVQTSMDATPDVQRRRKS